MRQAVIGRCALCKDAAILQDSHLLPKSLYRLARMKGTGAIHPIVLTRTSAWATDKQICKHLLCLKCERRFHEGGEDWVLRQIYRGRRFRLLDVLKERTPHEKGDPASYLLSDLPQVRPDQLSYFAVSVFWRAAVTDWQIDRHNISRISLGPSNMVRLGEYLLGKADFPANVSLNVVVCDGVDKWDLLMTPPSGGNGNGFNHYHFLVPGVAFHLCVGQKILVELRSSCIATGSRPVLFMQSHEQFFANADAVLGRPRTLSKRLVQMIEENEER